MPIVHFRLFSISVYALFYLKIHFCYRRVSFNKTFSIMYKNKISHIYIYTAI